jgi:hypothetical protein
VFADRPTDRPPARPTDGPTARPPDRPPDRTRPTIQQTELAHLVAVSIRPKARFMNPSVKQKFLREQV